MKHLLIASTLLVSSAYASETYTDYSHCQQPLMMEGLNITPDGKISTPFGFQGAPDVVTDKPAEDGSRAETLTFKSQMRALNGKPIEKIVKVTRDKEGRITSVSTSQDKMDGQQIQMFKQMALQNAVHSGLSMDSITYDPMVQINDADAVSQGFSYGKYVPLSKLSKKQAEQFGVDIDDLRKLRREVKKDKKALKKIQDGYEKLLAKSHMMLPNGAKVDFKIANGGCSVQSVQKGLFDTKEKKNAHGQKLDTDRCEKVNKISGKYRAQMQSCAMTNMQMSQELWTLDGGVGGVNGGYIGGSDGGSSSGTQTGAQSGAQSGSNSGQGVVVASAASFGVGGGPAGYNPYPGGFFMGSQEVMDCQMYFPSEQIYMQNPYQYQQAPGQFNQINFGSGRGIGW